MDGFLISGAIFALFGTVLAIIVHFQSKKKVSNHK